MYLNLDTSISGTKVFHGLTERSSMAYKLLRLTAQNNEDKIRKKSPPSSIAFSQHFPNHVAFFIIWTYFDKAKKLEKNSIWTYNIERMTEQYFEISIHHQPDDDIH